MINFSLYHGTSSYFLDEILIHGLGGKNISIEWGIKDFFKEVIFECNKVEDRNFQKNIINNQQIIFIIQVELLELVQIYQIYIMMFN